MNKSRKGVALIMALTVVLIGGAIIAITFNIVFSQAWISGEQKGGYVDHTTLRSAVESMKGRVISENITAGRTQHVHAALVRSADITSAEDLRFDNWLLDVNVSSGVGPQRVVVEVYDTYFDLSQVLDRNVLLANAEFFPPSFKMEGTQSTTITNDPTLGRRGRVLGRATHSSVNPFISAPTGGGLNLDHYGAYLLRARLFDRNNKLLRTAEELFVQILP